MQQAGIGCLANTAGTCAGKTLDQKIQRTFHLSRVAPSASVLGFMCELFFWSESTYQKFCSISVLSTFVGYLPDGNQRGMAETNRKLRALELAYPLKTRGRRQAVPGCIQKREQLLPCPPRPTEGHKVKGRPRARSEKWCLYQMRGLPVEVLSSSSSSKLSQS